MTDKRQQELLQKFYQEETTWCPEHVGYQLVAGITIGISMLFGVTPYQVWELSQNPSIGFMWNMLCLMGVLTYLQRYTAYAEGKKTKLVYDVLRYLPVSRRQLQIFIMKKIIKLCGHLAIVTICCQTVFAAAFLHTFSVMNIILPVGIDLLLPVLFVGLIVYANFNQAAQK